MKKAFVAAAAFAAMALGGAAQAATVYSGAGTPIPDVGTVSSNINVGDNFTLNDVNVTLKGLTHTFWADLDIALTHNGVTVWLTRGDNGGSGDPNGDYTFDDQAVTPVTSLGTVGGVFKSEELLSAFNGMSSSGLWTLTIADGLRGDLGNLNGWELSLNGSAVPEPATWAMMIVGFGAAGSMVRASRRKGVAAAA